MKKFVFVPVFLAFVIIFSVFTPVVTMSEDISNKVFRLHIIANSDSDEDQNLKLKVRDKVLLISNEIYEDCNSTLSAINVTNNNIDYIRNTSQRVIAYYGYDYPVKAYVSKEYFNTREYDGFTLPAGIYNCLKIVIGEGKGKNWWCVMFPQVCLSGCTDDFDNYLTEDEKKMLTSGGYKVKFKIVEIYERIKHTM